MADNKIGFDLSESAFRYRGLKVVVDTTEKAEFDIKGFQFSDVEMESIANQLRETAFTQNDRVVGDIRIRQIEIYDVAYIIGREGDTMVVTIRAC